MKQNIGKTDKIVRFVLASILIILFATGKLSGIVGVGAILFAVILIGTATINYCPIWKMFGISTRPKKGKKK